MARIAPFVIAVVTVTVLGAVGDAAAVPAKAKTVEGSFAGAVQGSQAYVAVYAHKPDKKGRRDVIAYVCDGAQMAEWFSKHRVKGNTLTLASHGGAHLKAKLTKKTATGAVTLADGTKLTFTAALVAEPAGLYRAEQTAGGDHYLGGWIVLPDGTQRGDIKRNGIIGSGSPGLVTTNPMVVLPGGVTLMAMYTD
jgi:hypothetical protein